MLRLSQLSVFLLLAVYSPLILVLALCIDMLKSYVYIQPLLSLSQDEIQVDEVWLVLILVANLGRDNTMSRHRGWAGVGEQRRAANYKLHKRGKNHWGDVLSWQT